MAYEKEEWRGVFGFPAYEVSSFGRVRRRAELKALKDN